MAGSLSHITDDDGTFRMDLIENLGDAQEALEEFHQFVAALAQRWGGDQIVRGLLKDLAFPDPGVLPVLQPELHGAASKWKTP